MTGSLQIKNNKFYMVLNTYENGKRKNKWICTDLPVKGNKTKAQKMLRDTLRDYEQEEERVADTGQKQRQRHTRENAPTGSPHISGRLIKGRINVL